MFCNSPIANPSSVKAAPLLFFLFNFSLQLIECSTKLRVWKNERLSWNHKEIHKFHKALPYILLQSNTKHLNTTLIWQDLVESLKQALVQSNTHQGGNNDVEVAQVHVLWAAEFGSKDIHQHFEILCSFCKVPGQVTEHRVQLPARDEQWVTWFY